MMIDDDVHVQRTQCSILNIKTWYNYSYYIERYV